MKIAIINYGMGNLASVRRSLEDLGADPFIAEHPSALYEAHKIILPGVGAFPDAMDCLHKGGWIEAINDVVTQKNRPLLGICLGMQMLASVGYEGKITKGLGLIPGKVIRLDALGCELRIPHVGWNEVYYKQDDALFINIPEVSDFYFVHSFAFIPDASTHLVATALYGVEVPAVVRSKNIFGCQFHPEKSSKAGRQLLRNFMEYQAC